ncbi:MAG TPA: hypothetical protein VHU82_00940, partial [Vicinamibacterales bacterium]|jgi:hypothetical protein|nr:hypothetical protein [Vicinamibacterales bacterium]
VIVPHPAPGVWSIVLDNASTLFETNPALTSGERAEYAITARLFGASLHPIAARGATVSVDIQNGETAIREPVLNVSSGTLRSHRGTFLPTGLPNQIDIAVPGDATTLALHLRGDTATTRSLELYLYDCTSGECFLYDFGFPAAPSQTLVVRKPKAGRWVAAVNAAPFPLAKGQFVLDEIITTGATRRSTAVPNPHEPGDRWTETVAVGTAPPPVKGAQRILFFELVDLASEHAEAERPWGNRGGNPALLNRPAALGTAIYRFE